MRVNERVIFREINKGLGMKYPLKGDISTTAHKANILIQVSERLPSASHRNCS